MYASSRSDLSLCHALLMTELAICALVIELLTTTATSLHCRLAEEPAHSTTCEHTYSRKQPGCRHSTSNHYPTSFLVSPSLHTCANIYAATESRKPLTPSRCIRSLQTHAYVSCRRGDGAPTPRSPHCQHPMRHSPSQSETASHLPILGGEVRSACRYADMHAQLPSRDCYVLHWGRT